LFIHIINKLVFINGIFAGKKKTGHTHSHTGQTFRPVALVEVGVVSVDPLTRKPTPLPLEFLKKAGLADRFTDTTFSTPPPPSANGPKAIVIGAEEVSRPSSTTTTTTA
jgi:hypothetical protein